MPWGAIAKYGSKRVKAIIGYFAIGVHITVVVAGDGENWSGVTFKRLKKLIFKLGRFAIMVYKIAQMV